ncbi:MAG: type II toxin-antitoxin system VapC family toxin [Potamolinea sp.]
MSSLLLDTHAFIWFAENDIHLPSSTREEIESADIVFVSIASLWEIAIKLSIGKLFLQSAYETIETQLDATGLTLLLISFADTAKIRHLPLHHRDPFDRIIVAQAMNHSLILISQDTQLDAYSIQRLWV